MFSPQGHTLPPDPDGIYLQAEHGLFAYGTLTSPVVRWIVLGESVATEEVILHGFRRDGLNLIASPGEQVEGGYFEVSGPQLRRLDRYERLGRRYYRAQYRLLDGREVWVYRRLEE
jgi:gamma-glutamylcyclotransferase (GGCT)/AIG2-like uncharacterized protein YtfP